MLGLLVALIAGFVALFGFLFWIVRDMRKGMDEMRRLTGEVEALLDDGA